MSGSASSEVVAFARSMGTIHQLIFHPVVPQRVLAAVTNRRYANQSLSCPDQWPLSHGDINLNKVVRGEQADRSTCPPRCHLSLFDLYAASESLRSVCVAFGGSEPRKESTIHMVFGDANDIVRVNTPFQRLARNPGPHIYNQST